MNEYAYEKLGDKKDQNAERHFLKERSQEKNKEGRKERKEGKEVGGEGRKREKT